MGLFNQSFLNKKLFSDAKERILAMKRRIVSLLLAVIMLFGLLPVTALAEKSTGDYWNKGVHYYSYNLDKLSYDGISINYTVYAKVTKKIAWDLYTRNIYGGEVQYRASDESTHEHTAFGDHVRHSFNSNKYWFLLKGSGEARLEVRDDDIKDQYDNLVSVWRTARIDEAKVTVYAAPLNVPMEDSTKPYLVSVTQKSKAAIEDEPRDVELYVEGKYVGKQVGAVRFPNREDAKASDLNIKVQDGFDIAKIEASGSTYKIYLVYGPRKVTIRYKLTGKHNTNGLVETNGLKNSTIANAVFQDKSWNQSNSFTKEYNQLPLSTVEIDTARSTNQLLLYEAADVKLVSGDAGIENSGTDKYKITVGYENSVIEVAYKAKFLHADPLYIDWYKRGAGGIFDLLQKNANQPYGFDLTNLHEQETFYVIQNGGLTQEAKKAGLGQEYVDSKGQHYRFWKAAVGFDWDWIDSLYYKSSAQTWFYTYKIDLYYRDIFAHEWKVWKTITVGPIEVPYDGGRINFVYQRYNPNTGEPDPEDKGDYSFTLAYDGNAGTEPIGVPQPTVMSNVALSDKGTYEIPVSRHQPERTDYKFLGWDENPNAKTPTYPAGNLGPVIFNGSDGKTQTKTLYAIWQKDGGDSATYTATYYLNYTENTNPYHTQKNLKTSDKLTKPADPTRDSYTFDGWYTTDTCTDGTKWVFEKDTVQKQDIYLYAKWTEAASADYTIYYYVDDVKDESKTETGSGSVGDEITAPDKKPTSGNYVLDTSRTPADLKLTLVEDSSENVLNVYYEKDEKGGGENGNDGPDGVPDKYQKKVTFKVVNGTWSDNTTTKDVYVTLLDSDGKWSETGTGTLTVPTDMTANATYDQASGKWDTPAPASSVTGTDPVTYTYRFSKLKVDYTIKYFVEGEEQTGWQITGSGEIGETINADTALNKPVGYIYDSATSIITKELGPKAEENVLEVYYEKDENHDSIPDKYQVKVTFKVDGGTWSNKTSDPIVKWLTLKDGSGNWSVDGSASYTTPTGMICTTSFPGYFATGSWSTPAPNADGIYRKADDGKEFTYSWTQGDKDDSQWATVTFVAGEHGSLTGTTTVTVLKGTAWNTITVPGTAPEAGYKFKEWTPDFPETITESATYAASFVINEGDWVTIRFIAGPNGSLEGQTTFDVVKGSAWSTITVPETKGDTGYTFLEWSPALPDNTHAIMESATYTAYFTKKDGDWVSVDYVIVGGHGDFVSGAQTHFEILKDTLWGEAGISAPAVEAEYGYYFDGWTGELAADEAISENITVVGRFEQEFDIIPAIIEILKPRDMLTKEHIAYLNGYSDGTVRPNGNITRAEVATIFFRLLTDEVRDANLTYGNTFTDVPNGAWYNAAVSTLSSMQIINGYTDGSFRPNQNITRAELASIIARFAELKNTSGVYFTDISGHWAAENICLAAANGWITGYSDGSFKPNRPVTRAETVTMINRVLERSPLSTDDLLDGMVTYSDNLDTTAWYYLAIQEASNTHDYTRMTVGEFWRALLPNRDWSRYQR